MAKKQEKMTLEKLAIMINNGFENAKMEYQKQHEEIKKELKKEIQESRQENTREHEEMKLRQDNVAYRFELADLQRRVEKIEKITKINFVNQNSFNFV